MPTRKYNLNDIKFDIILILFLISNHYISHKTELVYVYLLKVRFLPLFHRNALIA